MEKSGPARLHVAVTAAASLAAAAMACIPAGAQVASQLSKPLSREPATANASTSTRGAAASSLSALRPATATLAVKQVETKPGEFPPAAANQVKVAFECRIAATPAQTDYSKFPRFSCALDQKRTAEMSQLALYRVDYFPSADGVTAKVTVVADRSAQNPKPGRIRAAFQLMLEKSAGSGEPVYKDYIFADGVIAP